MGRKNVQTKTIKVTPGERVDVDIPQYGVLRLVRSGAAMTGKSEMTAEGGVLSMHFADGATVNLNAA